MAFPERAEAELRSVSHNTAPKHPPFHWLRERQTAGSLVEAAVWGQALSRRLLGLVAIEFSAFSLVRQSVARGLK